MAIQAAIESAAQAAPRRKKGLKPKLKIAGPRQARLCSADVAMTGFCASDADHFTQEHEGSVAVRRFIPSCRGHRIALPLVRLFEADQCIHPPDC
jgi:hypothetical protein